MSLSHGVSKLPRNGLVYALDPGNLNKHGSSPYKNLVGNLGTFTNTDFAEVDGIFRSNASPTTSFGTSNITMTGAEISTGSATVIFWIKLTSDPNTGPENEWRRLIANATSARSPIGFVLEENLYINFSITTTVQNYRHLDSEFTPTNATLNTWEMFAFTYNVATGDAAAYKNGALVRSGKMTDGVNDGNSTAVGEALNTLNTSGALAISNSKTSGYNDGCLPADLGPWFIYDRPLIATEISEIYEATRKRFGV